MKEVKEFTEANFDENSISKTLIQSNILFLRGKEGIANQKG